MMKKEKKYKKTIAKIALYLGIAASIATILQTVNVFFAHESNINMTATNNSESGTITQVQLQDGTVYVNNSNTTHKEYDNTQQNNLELSPSQFIAYSYDLIQQGNNELAVEEIQHFIDKEILDPMNIAILNYNLGVAYYNLGQYGMAESVLETAVATAGFSEAYYFLGVIRGTAFENYAKAILDFTKALEYERKTEYILARAWAYEQSNQLSSAYEDYYRVLQIDSQNELAKTGIERTKKTKINKFQRKFQVLCKLKI